MSILSEVKVPYFDFNVNSVSTRALTKHADQTIFISGQSGSHGFSGAHGFSGPPGRKGGSGYNGITHLNGGRGINGSKGSDGAPGRSGTDSQHALISLSGTVDTLNMDLKIFQTLNNLNTHSSNSNWTLVQPIREINYQLSIR